MNAPPSLDRRTALALALTVLLLAAGFRLLRATLLPELPNFSPVMALALCGAFVLPGSLALLAPLGALVLSDLALNLHYHVAPFGFDELLRYACYGLGVASGLALRRLGIGLPGTLAAVVANSLLFYLVTNTTSWLGNPAYPQSLAGWIQSLTVGQPGFPPTWTFLRTSLLSDLLFATLFLLAFRRVARPAPAPRAALAPSAS